MFKKKWLICWNYPSFTNQNHKINSTFIPSLNQTINQTVTVSYISQSFFKFKNFIQILLNRLIWCAWVDEMGYVEEEVHVSLARFVELRVSVVTFGGWKVTLFYLCGLIIYWCACLLLVYLFINCLFGLQTWRVNDLESFNK